jgi:hypothetical protein
MIMEKVDIKKELKALYAPSARKPSEVEVPGFNYIMIDGKGDPNTSKDFSDAIEALYSVSYTLKFMIKKGPQAIDYHVMPLEGLWWADDMMDFVRGDKSKWSWTLMIMQPEYVTRELYDQAIVEADRKKKPAAIGKLRLEYYQEGLSMQMMHIGPFSTEITTVKVIEEAVTSHGYVPSGKHHEIYLSDFRRASPEKMKTVLRLPVKKAVT